VQLLNMLFNIDFEVLKLETREPDHIDVRCSLRAHIAASCPVQSRAGMHRGSTHQMQLVFMCTCVPSASYSIIRVHQRTRFACPSGGAWC
jgi:hypothetical protein